MRNSYFDALRGIAIISVIGIHTFSTSVINSSYDEVAIIIRQFITFAVPLFLAISGFFLEKKSLLNWHDITHFWKRQIPKVYIPTLIWSIPYFAQSLIIGGNPKNNLILLFVCGYSVYYYIALIIQYYILLPFIKKKNFILISLILSFCSIILVCYISIIKGLVLPLILQVGFFSIWLIFFMLGINLSKSNRSYGILLPIILSVLGLIASYGEEIYFLNTYGEGLGATKISSYCFSIGIILILFSSRVEAWFTKRNLIFIYLADIGKASFGIYLTHLYILKFIRLIEVPDIWLLRWISVLILDYLLILLLRKVLPHKFLCLLGLMQ